MMTLKERIFRLVELKEREIELKEKTKLEKNTMTLNLTQDWELELKIRRGELLSRKSAEIQLERVREEIKEEIDNLLEMMDELELERVEFNLGDKTVVIQRTDPNLLIIKNKKSSKKEVKENEG
jgi:hypothetical protein